MIEFFYKGGPIFMGLLTLIMLVVILSSIIALFAIIKGNVSNNEEVIRKVNRIRSFGLLAFVIGLLGQIIGLYSAFRALRMGEVEASTSLFVNGFKISMISSAYGLTICCLSLIIWFLINYVFRCLRIK